MREKIDPYFQDRLEQGRAHRIVGTIEGVLTSKEVEPNKELPNPIAEGSLEDFGWSEKAVDNFIDALSNGFIGAEWIDEEKEIIRIEFLPLEKLPEQMGHVAEIEAVQKNLRKKSGLFGLEESDKFTYLQTVDFAVEGYMDDETEGKKYARLFINSKKLLEKRNVYLDPESLNVTDYEYGYSFAVKGGMPMSTIDRVDVIKARKEKRKSQSKISETIEPEDMEAYVEKQIKRLRDHLKTLLSKK